MSLTIQRQNGTNTNAPQTVLTGNGPFVFTFTPEVPVKANSNANSNAIAKKQEKSSLLRELVLLLDDNLDSLNYTFSNNDVRQVFGEYQDDDDLMQTLHEIISLMNGNSKNKLESDNRIRIRIERLNKVHSVDLLSPQPATEGGRKKRASTKKRASGRRRASTKKH